MAPGICEQTCGVAFCCVLGANVRDARAYVLVCMCVFPRHKDGLLAPFMPEVHPDAVLILEDDAELKPRCTSAVDRLVDLLGDWLTDWLAG